MKKKSKKPTTTGQVVKFSDYSHPKIGDVYELDEDVLVVIISKNDAYATAQVLTDFAANNSTITMSNRKFNEENHLGNYEELINQMIW